MLLKICGVARREDAEYLDGKVDYVGFIPDPSAGARSVDPATARAIAASLSRSKPVAVFAGVDPLAAARMASELGAVLQHPALAGEEVIKQVAAAVPGVKLAPVVYVSSDAAARAARLLGLFGDLLEYVLIDAPKRGFSTYELGLKFPLSLVEELRGLRVGVAGGIGPGNVGAVASRGPFLIDISSGVESSPGVKDPGKIGEVLRVVKG